MHRSIESSLNALEKMDMKKLPQFWQSYLKREWRDIRSFSLFRACVAEFIGLFMLTFFGVSCTMLSGNQEPVSSVHVALETGFYIAVGITTFQHISGGHINPSISTGFFVTGQISAVRFILYVISQTLGGIAGAGIVHLITPEQIKGGFGVILPGPQVSDAQAFVCDMIITFMMLFGTMAMIDEGRKDVHGFAPLMIGLLVSIGVFSGWNISGGCMNPARNLGPALITGKLDKMWIYWGSDLLGAVIGSLLYERMFSTKVCGGCLGQDCSQMTDNPEAHKYMSDTLYITGDSQNVQIVDKSGVSIVENTTASHIVKNGAIHRKSASSFDESTHL